MNDQELDEAAFLVFQKVKITLAVIIIKSTPENLNVRNYAAMFQDKFRKRASRVNLHLEKKLFHEQLLLLLPAFCTSSSQKVDYFGEPMDVDVLGDMDDPSLQPTAVPPAEEDDRFYVNTIHSLSRFLDALIKAELLTNSSRMIVRNDVSELLVTCEEASLPYPCRLQDRGNRHCTSISCNLLKFVLRSVNVVRITSECVSTMVGLLRKYLKIWNRKGFSHCVAAVRYANEVLFKYTENFQQNSESTSFIMEFVRNSTREFFELSADERTCRCWFAVFGCWRRNESVCAAEINALFGVIRELDFNSRFARHPSEYSGEHLLDVLKRMLSSYAKLYLLETESFSLKNGGKSRNINRCVEKPAELRKLDVSHWEKMMRNVVLECIEKKQPMIQASWTCFKIIMLMKCQLKPKIKEIPSHEKRIVRR